MHEDAHQHRVLDHIGEIAGVKGVAIIHGRKVMAAKSWGAKSCAQSHAPEFAAVKVVKRLSRVRGGSSSRALEHAALSWVPRWGAWSACCALARERGAAAAYRRHDEL